jgi:hypothetical protein
MSEPSTTPADPPPNAWEKPLALKKPLAKTKRKSYKYTQGREMKYVQTENVDGDGDCLFASILSYKRIPGGIQELRAQVSEYLRSNSEEFIATLPLQMKTLFPKIYTDKMTDAEILEKYQNDMKENGVWGDDLCMVIISKIHSITMIVLETKRNRKECHIDKQPNVTMTVKRVENDDSYLGTDPMYLLYNGENHYDAIQFIDADTYNKHEDQVVSKHTVGPGHPSISTLAAKLHRPKTLET